METLTKPAHIFIKEEIQPKQLSLPASASLAHFTVEEKNNTVSTDALLLEIYTFQMEEMALFCSFESYSHN